MPEVPYLKPNHAEIHCCDKTADLDPLIAGQDPLLKSSQIDITGLDADSSGFDGIDDNPQHPKDVSNVFEPNGLSRSTEHGVLTASGPKCGTPYSGGLGDP